MRRLLWAGAGLAAQASVLDAAELMARAERRAREKAAWYALPIMRPRCEPQGEARIDLNQVGYLPHDRKRAVIVSSDPIAGNGFNIVDAELPHHRRFGGVLCAAKTADSDESHIFYAHFDSFQRPGRYRLRLSDGRLSDAFSIDRGLYAGLIPLTLQFFAMQTCGADCDPLHGLCHHDDGVAAGGPRDGQPLDGSGGWHDAGDYLKFVETTSYVAGLMLFACDRFPRLAEPVAGGPSPLMKQARVGLDWLLKMHPTPDEFYYQVGDASDHDRWRLPEQDRIESYAAWKPREIRYGVGANLAGRTAAALALASRLYAGQDRLFAQRCLLAAQSVYALGLQHPVVLTTEPSDFYPESTWTDDMAWGAAELFRATRQSQYLQQALDFAHRAGAAGDQTSVYNTHALAHSTLYALAPDEDRERLRRYLRDDADLARLRANNVYGLATPYIWGTAEAAVGAALNCLLYAHLDDVGGAERSEYLDVARYNRDFVLGCNPFGLSNLIGAGTRYPHFPHHQVANLKGIELTGALVGGPTDARVFRSQKIVLTQPEMGMITGPPPPPDTPGRTEVYHDAVQDYVTNEPAIDYTAKFLLLAAFYSSHSRAHS
jgi:hypothetical protein